MSAVLVLTPVLTPVIIGGWPVITAAVAGAATALGLVAKSSAKQKTKAAARSQVQAEENAVEVELSESAELAKNLVSEEEIVLTKGTITLRVRRDERGRCTVCATGLGHTKAELKAMAEEFTEKLTQCFIYNRIKSEVKAKGFQVVNEEQMADQTVRIHLRRWEE